MNVARIHLKTSTKNRDKLIQYCLKDEKQFLAIGWSYIYETNKICNYRDYYFAVKNNVKRINPVLNVFLKVEENDLFWTRDLDNYYWICRVKDEAKSMNIQDLDIGAVVPIEAYKYSMEVPGQIKASFTRPQ